MHGGARQRTALTPAPPLASPCRRFAIVQPMSDHSKLEVQREGLDLLRSIKGTVCPVAVIGPYRSGKSFTLNQLMGVACGGCGACPALPCPALPRLPACG